MTQHPTHFDKISGDYHKAGDTWSSVYVQAKKRVEPLIRDRAVLDVGNGGYFFYNASLARELTCLDISPAMLESIQDPRIRKIVADARDMKGVEDGSMDTILFGFTLHHIIGTNVRESLDTLDALIAASHKKLKSGGCLAILEPVLTGGWYGLEKNLFGLTRRVLSALRREMIFFHKSENIVRALAAHFKNGPAAVRQYPLEVRGWVDPLGGSFPGRIKIPSGLLPTKYFLFEAHK